MNGYQEVASRRGHLLLQIPFTESHLFLSSSDIFVSFPLEEICVSEADG